MSSMLALLLGLTLVAAPAAADLTFDVESTSDEPDAAPGDGNCVSAPGGTCTLRAAIQEANARDEPILVLLDAREYTLLRDGADEDASSTGDLDVVKANVTVRGAGAGETRVRTVREDRVFDVRATGGLTLEDLTVQEGFSDRGGGIRNLGLLILDRVTVRLNHSLFGGGVFHDGALLVVRRSTIAWNAGLTGGGMAAYSFASVTDSTIDHNQSRSGGGIFGGIGGALILVNVTVSGNRASESGGGLALAEPAGIRNSTIADNVAAQSGGGIEGRFTIVPSDVGNSILAGNHAAEGPDCAGETAIVAPSLIEDQAGCTLTGDAVAITGVDAGLEPLAPRGGPVATHGLVASSPAVDAGAVDGCLEPFGEPIETDARGEARAADGLCRGTARCDLGAFERPAERDDDADGAIDAGCPGGTDCDDADTAVLPGVLDVCNGVDDDCTGTADDGLGCSPVRGTLLALRDGDARSLVFKSRQPGLVLPGRGAPADPTCRNGAGGAVLDLFGLAGSGRVASVALPCTGWSAAERDGEMQSYVFADPDGACRTVRITRKGLVAKCAAGLDLEPGGARRVGLTLTTGGVATAAGMRQYCADFGGRVRRDDETRFVAAKADAPVACPVP